jgi:hypothetical protein
MVISVKQSKECLAWDTEVLGENLHQGRSGGKPATNRLSYAAKNLVYPPQKGKLTILKTMK